ncbi:hypothetical protein CHKEEEPN_2484 [Methylorubrum podarium]|nr:hypothetical protein CHKEEEPN_2484 [Methylorubrum podarium]
MNEVMNCFKVYGSDRLGFKEAVTALVGREARQVNGEVVRSLNTALERFAAAEVALLLVDLETAQGDGSDLLLRLFERVGAGGTALSESERLYSIYKHHFPRVRDLVEAIEVSSGRIMTSTLIANTALRIANVSSSEAHEAPVPHALGALLNPRRSDDRAGRFRHALFDLLPTEGCGNISTSPTTGRLTAAFARVIGLLRFEPAQNPEGLPKLMLAELPHELVQVMVYWAVCADAPGRVASRFEAAEVIRFALFWRLCATSHLQCARNAIHWLRARKKAGADLSIFPGLALYRLLTGQAEGSWGQNARLLVPPNQMLDFNWAAPRGATWLSSKNRFEHDQTHPARRLFHAWWWSGGQMLLWLQRRYLEAEFAHYDPLSEHDDDRPIDLDHLQPKAHWRFDWRQRDQHLAQLPDVGERWAFNEGRDPLGNSVGNYRWVGSAKNRSDGALGLADKLRRARGDDGGEIEPWLAEAFDPGAIDAWIMADASKGWTGERVAQFQRVVEERGLWLYRRFFEGAGFELWLDEPTGA